MAEIKIYLSEPLDKRFRKAAMDVFGYGRGSISKAAEEAFLQWCQKHEEVNAQAINPATTVSVRDGSPA